MTELRDPDRAAWLRGRGPAALAVAALVLVAATLLGVLRALPILLWAWASRTPWRELGLQRPASWVRTIAGGVLAGALFKLAMKSLVMPLLGAPPVNAAYQHLAGDTAALPGMLLAVTLGAGFGEELLFRGWLFERVRAWFGWARGVRVATVLLTSALFAVVHLPEQGVPGVQQALVTGLAFGTWFAATGRLWPVVIAHAAFDVTAVAILYWRWEAAIAHWFVR